MTYSSIHRSTGWRLAPPGALLLAVAGLLAWPAAAEAQLDPLLMLKRPTPTVSDASYRANVLLAVDTSPRMQFDADGTFYDPAEYTRGSFWDSTLGVSPADVSVKGKTNEGMGWIGRGEGLACIAVATLVELEG